MPQKNSGEKWNTGDAGVPILAIQTSASAAANSNGQWTPLQIDEQGQLRVAAAVSLGANSSVNISQVGGQTAATGGAGILSVALGGTSTVALASGSAVIGALTANQTINLAQVGGQTAATGGAGVLSVVSNITQIGGQTAATGGAGVLSVSSDLAKVGGTATVTASAGIQRVHAIESPDTQVIYSSGLAKKPIFLQISASASGSNLLVASAASTVYRILAYNLMSNGAVNAQFLSSATPMGGITYCPTAGVGKVAPYCPIGWMETTAGHSLNLNLSASVAVGGELVYIAI